MQEIIKRNVQKKFNDNRTSKVMIFQGVSRFRYFVLRAYARIYC